MTSHCFAALLLLALGRGFDQRKLLGKALTIDGLDTATLVSAISYGDDKVELQFWGKSGKDLTTILAVVQATENSASMDSCISAVNGVAQANPKTICDALLVTLQSLPTTPIRNEATAYSIADDRLQVKLLGDKLRQVKRLKFGQRNTWDIVAAATLDRNKRNVDEFNSLAGNAIVSNAKLLFIAKHTFAEPEVNHASMVVVVNWPAGKFEVVSILFAMNGRAEPTPINTDAKTVTEMEAWIVERVSHLIK